MSHIAAQEYLGLFTCIKNLLFSEEFKERQRQKPTNFTRQRYLPFVVVVIFLLNLIKRALQDEFVISPILSPGLIKLLAEIRVCVGAVVSGVWVGVAHDPIMTVTSAMSNRQKNLFMVSLLLAYETDWTDVAVLLRQTMDYAYE